MADCLDDPVLASLYEEPVVVRRPKEQLLPFVFASPHSGRDYPSSFVAESRLSPLMLRRSEDAYADALFGSVTTFGAPLLCARFPRAYVDANRAAGELDPEMFDAALPFAIDAASPRVAAGLGVIPRVVREGAEIYRARLATEEASMRLERLYHPYHDALAQLVEDTYRHFGCAVVVDCHSMPSAPSAPNIVFGDCHGTSVSPELMAHAQEAFAKAGFSTARNAPYAGGYTTHRYSKREQGVHALQIEVNRGLYLDEERIETLAHFEVVKARLRFALLQLVGFAWPGLVQHRPIAAE